MSRLKAQELMDNPQYIANLSMEGLYDLLVRAGYDTGTAHSEAKEHAMNRLISGRSI